MKASRTSSKITVTGILNESLLEDVKFMAQQSSCKTESKDNMTKMIVTGTEKQLGLFIKLWNA